MKTGAQRCPATAERLLQQRMLTALTPANARSGAQVPTSMLSPAVPTELENGEQEETEAAPWLVRNAHWDFRYLWGICL